MESKKYTIRQTRRYYGPRSETTYMKDIVFDTKAEGLDWIKIMNHSPYELDKYERSRPAYCVVLLKKN